MMKVYIREDSWLAKLAAAKMKAAKVALVMGDTIHLHNTTREEFLADQDWVCHELKHVEQYRRYGVQGFLARYVLEWLKKGYYHNRFEQEARDNEPNRVLLKGVEFG